MGIGVFIHIRKDSGISAKQSVGHPDTVTIELVGLGSDARIFIPVDRVSDLIEALQKVSKQS